MLHRKILAAAFAASSLVAIAPATATTTFFTDFDDHVVDGGPPSGGAGYDIVQSIEGWNAASGAGIEIQNGVAGAAFSPINLVELDSDNNSSMERIIEAGDYDLKFWYSPRPGVPLTSNGIDVLLDGTSIFQITGTGAGDGSTDWSQQYLQFSLASAGVLRFEAIGTSESLGGYVDSIALSNAVPEPATWAMMIGGFGLVGGAMRRRGRMAVRLA